MARYFAMVGGDLVEIDRASFNEIVDDGNRTFELTDENPNDDFRRTWEDIQDSDYPDDDIEVVVLDEGYGEDDA